jgi:hypothetical protein
MAVVVLDHVDAALAAEAEDLLLTVAPHARDAGEDLYLSGALRAVSCRVSRRSRHRRGVGRTSEE